MKRELYNFLLPVLAGVIILFGYEPVRQIFSAQVSRLVTVGGAIALIGLLHGLLTNRGLGISLSRGVALGLGSALAAWIAKGVV